MLGRDLDQKVKHFLLALGNRKVTYSIAIATAKTLIERSSHGSLQSIKPSINWVYFEE